MPPPRCLVPHRGSAAQRHQHLGSEATSFLRVGLCSLETYVQSPHATLKTPKGISLSERSNFDFPNLQYSHPALELYTLNHTQLWYLQSGMSFPRSPTSHTPVQAPQPPVAAGGATYVSAPFMILAKRKERIHDRRFSDGRGQEGRGG